VDFKIYVQHQSALYKQCLLQIAFCSLNDHTMFQNYTVTVLKSYKIRIKSSKTVNLVCLQKNSGEDINTQMSLPNEL